MYNCFGCMKQLVWGDGYDNAPVEVSYTQPSVQIDTSHIGTDVVVVKQGKRICGTGGALACAPIAQDKAYFEVKIQSTGVWGIGLATKNYNAQNELGACSESWALKDDGALLHNGEEKGKLTIEIEEGDVIGCSYDHVELCFYRNGNRLEACITGIKGCVYPAFYVDEGAILDTVFTGFYHSAPAGFGEMMIEQDIL